MRRFSVPLLLSVLLVSCTFRGELRQAEIILAEHPDSALRMLDQMRPSEQALEGVRARHALLLSMAMQGAGKVPESDSAARVAFDYYSRHRDLMRRMHAANCLAEVEYEYGKFTDAILHYHDALSCAVDLQDTRMEGFICQRLGELFALNYDHEESLSYAKRAEECLSFAGESLSAAYSSVDQARQLLALNQLPRARSMADSLLDANRFGDPGYSYYLFLLKADISNEEGNEKEALHYYNCAEKTGYSLPLNSMASYILLIQQQGPQSEMDSLLNRLRGHILTAIDSMVYQGILIEQSRLSGDYERAFLHLTLLSDIQNRSYTSVISRSATHALKAYFEDQYLLERMRRRTQMIALTLVILILAIAVVISIVLLRLRRLRLEQEMSLVETLNQDIRLMEKGKKRSDTVITAMMKDKIETMSKLTDAYFSWTDEAVRLRDEKKGRSNKEDVIRSFRDELKDLRSDKAFLQAIEDALNQSSGKIMELLRNDFSGLDPSVPKYGEADFHFVMLFFAGFSNKSVSFIMDMTDEAVRSKKKRCKQHFLALSDGRGQKYVELL